ncbi:MAG TPA: tetratricopeptide repeat protein [Acetobacteraceae bacterium]|jgi:tetratricopeptide (TPR) repeat protein
MQHSRSLGRASLLALSLLSACAAAEPLASSSRAVDYQPSGVDAAFLVGHVAELQSNPNVAATAFLKALAARPNDPEIKQQAFIAALLDGRPEAVQLARQLPNNQVARLVLVNQDVRSGNWQAAETGLQDIPRQGLTQLLQPLMLAWTLAGAGQTDAALATLQPFIDGQRFRGTFALHAGMIADVADRPADAAKFYAIANAEMPDLNLRLAQILASWQTRSGHAAAAERTLGEFAEGAPDMVIALPRLLAASRDRPVTGPSDGIAEAYLALAAALRGEDSDDLATIMLRLALNLRPDFTAARVVGAEILMDQQHNAEALHMLAAVSDSDPLSPVVRMRRAQLTAQLGHPGDALHDLDRIAAQYPDSALPAVEQGDILSDWHRYVDAIAAYSRAIDRMMPVRRADWAVFYQRGVDYDHMQRWPQAEADFRQALTLVPNQPSVLNYLGYTWANKDEHLAEARQMIQKAAAGRPDDGAIIDSLGWVMLRQGEVSQAVTTLQRAVELDPEDSTLNAHLGDAYAAAGRKLEAQYQWRRALTLNPTADDATKLEAKLQLPKGGAMVSGQ